MLEVRLFSPSIRCSQQVRHSSEPVGLRHTDVQLLKISRFGHGSDGARDGVLRALFRLQA
jgi:hypothetical protein